MFMFMVSEFILFIYFNILMAINKTIDINILINHMHPHLHYKTWPSLSMVMITLNKDHVYPTEAFLILKV
jgi:hypothetical protein